MSSNVHIRFPSVGLGNRLLIWARGYVFAMINNVPYYCSSWAGIHPGAWLRNEKHKRVYYNYFKESPLVERFMAAYLPIHAYSVVDPMIEKRELLSGRILFTKIDAENGLFTTLFNYRDLIRAELAEILHPSVIDFINNAEVPQIAFHIRRGDFKVANQHTPLDFYIDVAQFLNESKGIRHPITIFSDAGDDELLPLLQMPGVKMAAHAKDIADIILMSKSKVIVTSRSSTFSYWAAFLSDAIVIKPEGDWQKKICVNHLNEFVWTEKSKPILRKLLNSL